MSLWDNVVTQVLKKRAFVVRQTSQDPHNTQNLVFSNLIRQAKNTEWGRKYDYKSIANPAEFGARVPISTYEQIFPYIERMMQGQPNILWPSHIKCFSKSSGTTNARSKFIPVSNESLKDCHYKCGKDLIALYLENRPDTQVLHGKNMVMGGSLQPNPYGTDAYTGDISAIIMKNLPFWAQWMRVPNLQTALMSNWEEKLELIAQAAIKKNVTCISGVPTWTVLVLKRILEISGAQTISQVWPKLEVFLHGAVAFDPYRQLFNDLIGSDKMSYLESYNASEGFFGVQDDLELPNQMMLMLDYGIYFEFVPLETLETENPIALSLDQVVLDQNYALVISTNAGLWRYLIGDTVRFTSLAPYRIRVSGRTRHFINAFGEELMVENADQAISEASLQTGAVVSDYTAAPVYMGQGSRGAHEWAIEFDKSPDSMAKFTEVLDTKLRQINSDYDAKRHQNLALSEPVVHALPKDSFYNWLKKKNRIGGQSKVPRLSNSREYLDQILDENKIVV